MRRCYRAHNAPDLDELKCTHFAHHTTFDLRDRSIFPPAGSLAANPPLAMSFSTHRFAIDDVETFNHKLELLLSLYEEREDTSHNESADFEHIVGKLRRQEGGGSSQPERSNNDVIHIEL